MVDLDYGWILCSGGYASGGMNLASEGIKWNVIRDPVIEHYPGGGHVGYDPGTEWIEVKIDKIRAKTYENATGIIENVRSYNDIGAWDLELQIDSGGSKFPWDGITTGIKVFFKSFKGIHKKAAGDGTLYVIESAQFEEGG